MQQSVWCRVVLPAVTGGCLLLGAAPPVIGQTPPDERRAERPEALGRVDFGVSCAPSVTQEFDRGIALLHHMTYPAALEAFERVTRSDPGCALAYWGAAMTLFQPLWPNRPTASDLSRGWTLVQEARLRMAGGGRDSMFVATGEAFFDPAGEPEYWARIERWADAMTDLYVAHPDDREVRALFALAHLATASRGDARAHHEEAAAVLATILAEEPTHPGAVHYTIHANDFDVREHESLHVVRSYGDIAPANAHALHMPTHIFVRLGEWQQVIDWNRRAAAAALQQRVGPAGEHVWDEFPHAIEYLVYAELQRGNDASARELIRSLHETPDLEPSFKTAFHFASTASRFSVERQDWAQAAVVPVRAPADLDWDLFPWPEALAWFTRGFGAAHLPGSEATVVESLGHLERLRQRAAAMGEPLFSTQIEILRLEVTAWQALAEGDGERAVRTLEDAVELEQRTPKHPVTPGATAPARELLGDLLLALGEPARARDAYLASSTAAPGRFNTTLGLARSSAAVGDADTARSHYRALLDAAAPASRRPALAEARAYLARG